MWGTLHIAFWMAVITLGSEASTTSAVTRTVLACPDTLQYVIRPGDNLTSIAERHRSRTLHYAIGDLLGDIRAANGLESDLLRPGRRLVIPTGSSESYPLVQDPVCDGADLRGIYLTGPVCGSSSVFKKIDTFIEAGGNGVVFDAKDTDGGVTFATRHPLISYGSGRDAPVISRLRVLVRRLHARRMYVAARIACFLDGELGWRRPDLALVDSAGTVWTERNQVWVDPANPTVRDYNIALAIALAQAGVDEIQFDYVRFPTNGWATAASGDQEAEALHRQQVIAGFLMEARDALDVYQVKIAADIYGVMAWGRTVDVAVTGQYLPALAEVVDVICPMVYPSHYGRGFSGIENPADHPAHFVAEGCRRFIAMVAGRAEIRPWLQAFPYGVSRYDGQYVLDQIAGAQEAGVQGWCLWNPASRYDAALSALRTPELASVPGLQGASEAELSGVNAPSVLWPAFGPCVLAGSIVTQLHVTTP